MCHRKLQIDLTVVIGYLLTFPFRFLQKFIWKCLSFSILAPILCQIDFSLCTLCCANEKKFLSVSYCFRTCLFNACMVFHSILFLLFFITIYIVIFIINVVTYVLPLSRFVTNHCTIYRYHHQHCCMRLVGVGDNHFASMISTVKKMYEKYIAGSTI